ncbi:MAG: hypothetical protein PHX18_04525 [Candidatus Gastranaerophilales bacterium]|nr:hypothetical protein [Candidatus Gastranaerophilales bacterium]
MKRTFLFSLLLIIGSVFLITGLFLQDILAFLHINPSKTVLYIEKIIIYAIGFMAFWLFRFYKNSEEK